MLVLILVDYGRVKGQAKLKYCAWPRFIEDAYKSMMEIHDSLHKWEPQSDSRFSRNV
jgi:hypothetical protein